MGEHDIHQGDLCSSPFHPAGISSSLGSVQVLHKHISWGWGVSPNLLTLLRLQIIYISEPKKHTITMKNKKDKYSKYQPYKPSHFSQLGSRMRPENQSVTNVILQSNKYPNVFRCSYFCRMNIQMYLPNLYLVNEYPNILGRYNVT